MCRKDSEPAGDIGSGGLGGRLPRSAASTASVPPGRCSATAATPAAAGPSPAAAAAAALLRPPGCDAPAVPLAPLAPPPLPSGVAPALLAPRLSRSVWLTCSTSSTSSSTLVASIRRRLCMAVRNCARAGRGREEGAGLVSKSAYEAPRTQFGATHNRETHPGSCGMRGPSTSAADDGPLLCSSPHLQRAPLAPHRPVLRLLIAAAQLAFLAPDGCRRLGRLDCYQAVAGLRTVQGAVQQGRSAAGAHWSGWGSLQRAKQAAAACSAALRPSSWPHGKQDSARNSHPLH